MTLSSLRWGLEQDGPLSSPAQSLGAVEMLLGLLAVWARRPGGQGGESVAELAPHFLVKPLILPNACFCVFQVVLGPLCHQLWAFRMAVALG